MISSPVSRYILISGAKTLGDRVPRKEMKWYIEINDKQQKNFTKHEYR